MTENTASILRTRALLIKNARIFLDNNQFTEVQPPILLPNLGEKLNSFNVEYLDVKAVLTKGFLPYGRFFAEKLGKAYAITPSFRKEEPSARHLYEYWRLEAIQTGTLGDVMYFLENLIAFIIRSLTEITERNPPIKINLKRLEKIEKPLQRISYDEAIQTLQISRVPVFWGQEINLDQEKLLSSKFEQPFFIYHFPYTLEKIIHERDSQKPQLSLSADLIAPLGYGELASCLQMVTNKEEIIDRMRNYGLDEKNREWFSSFFNDAQKPYSAFALGVERLIQWICELDQIELTTAFPRNCRRFYP